MIHDDNKTERILKMIQLLKAHPQGLSRKDIARLLDIDLSTVSRYIRDCSSNLPLFEDDDKRLHLEPDKFKLNMELTIHELVFVHLASRLFLRSLDTHNPYAISCLEKLSALFEQFSPDISRFLSCTVSAMNKPSGKQTGNYLNVLKDLTTGWILQRKLKITHYSHRRKTEATYLYHPYWLEPGSGKTSVYAIGYSEEEEQYRTFKINRIMKTELLKQSFLIKEDFKIEDYLGHAWGVWKSDSAPVAVVLKFSKTVAERVLENSWHETESTEIQPDGALLWMAAVAQPLEMYPWIRGWGADVEVIEPLTMRDAMREEVERLKKIYAK